MLRTARRTSLLLIAVLVLSACGGGDGSDTPETALESAPESAPEPAAEAPSADDDATDDAAEDAAIGLAAAEGITVTVHRTESCSCCGQYEAYLDAAGFTVEQVIHEDLVPVKAAFGIPDDERSCHTNELGGYVAEGHVPAEALLQLLDEAPEISGISLAGMPAGSPGMPGEQEAPFEVRTFIDGEVVGELGSF